MNKKLTFALALALVLGALTGCGGKTAAVRDPEELRGQYEQAVTAHGGELAQHNGVYTAVSDEDLSAALLELLGLQAEDMTAFAVSASLVNVKAFGIAAVMPAEGKEEAVTAALQGFIDLQKQNFERYLADQYEVADSARLETLADGTVLLVMCQDQDTVFDAIKTDIEG